MRWRAVPREALAWRLLDDQWVVRNARTGSTHLLDARAGEVLQALADTGDFLTADELTARLAERFPGENGAPWADHITQTLSEFRRLGLAEAEAPPSGRSAS